MDDSEVGQIVAHAPTSTIVAKLTEKIDAADAAVDNMSKILQCDCGRECHVAQKLATAKNPMKQDKRASAILPDLGAFKSAHEAPFVVCQGLHIFEASKQRRSARKEVGTAPNSTPVATRQREARLGLHQGGCVVCAQCYFSENYTDKQGECKGCLRRKVMLPSAVQNDPNLGTLFIPHDKCPQLQHLNAIHREVDALKPVLGDIKKLGNRAGQDASNRRVGADGEALEEFEDEVQSLTSNGNGEGLDAIGIDNATEVEPPAAEAAAPNADDEVRLVERRRKASLAEIDARDALNLHDQTKRELAATASAIANCNESLKATTDPSTIDNCKEQIAELEKTRDGQADTLAAREATTQEAFAKYYDLARGSLGEAVYETLSTEGKQNAFQEFSDKNLQEAVAPNPDKAPRAQDKRNARAPTPKQILDKKYAELLAELQQCNKKPKHVLAMPKQVTAEGSKWKARVVQEKTKWRSNHLSEVRVDRDAWFNAAVGESQHKKFFRANLKKELTEEHGLSEHVFNKVYKECEKRANEELDAFQGECLVEGGEEKETPAEAGDRVERKRKYDDFFTKEWHKGGGEDEDGEPIALSDQEDLSDNEGSKLQRRWRKQAGPKPVNFRAWVKTEEGRATISECDNGSELLDTILQQEGADNESADPADEPMAAAADGADDAADADAAEANLE